MQGEPDKQQCRVNQTNTLGWEQQCRVNQTNHALGTSSDEQYHKDQCAATEQSTGQRTFFCRLWLVPTHRLRAPPPIHTHTHTHIHTPGEVCRWCLEDGFS